MEKAQNLEVGGIYNWKRGRNDYMRVQLSELPNPDLGKPYDKHVKVRVFHAGDPEDQATGGIHSTHKDNLYVKSDEDMVAGRKRKTRRRRTHKRRKTLSKRK